MRQSATCRVVPGRRLGLILTVGITVPGGARQQLGEIDKLLPGSWVPDPKHQMRRMPGS